MKVIALKGDSNSGKTSILKSLIIKLIEKDHFSVKWLHGVHESHGDHLRNNWFGQDRNYHFVRDCNIVLSKDITVAISTVGDSIFSVERAYETLQRHTETIDIFICACHPNQEMVDYLNNLALPNAVTYKVVYIDDYGVAHDMPTEVKDGKIIFTTDHFSRYAIVGVDAPIDNTSSGIPTWAIVLIACAGVIAVAGTAVFLVVKKKKTAK